MTWSKVSAWLCGLLLVACSGPTDPYKGLQGARYADASGALLYRYYVPPAASREHPLPLVLYLHSNGRQGADNTKHIDFRVTRWVEDQARHPCFVLAPQLPQGYWVDWDFKRGNYALDALSITPALQMTIRLLRQLLDKYPIDRSRLYVVGTSLGGFGTWDLLAREPDRFAAAVPIEGGGDPSKAQLFAQVPIWAFHGARDQTVPVAATRAMIEALRAAGGSPKYTEYADIDHEAPSRVFLPQTGLDDWLFAQRRPGAPAPL
jgi:predicted peptidase